MDSTQDARAHAADGTRPSYLTFFIGDEEYGVPIRRAREILRLSPITQVPSAPACVRGVINLRGTAVPVVDLAIEFKQAECVPTRFTCVVVVDVWLEAELTVMGLMVDSVNQTVELAAEDIEPVPSFGTRAPSHCLLGMGRTDWKFVLLLDIDRVLSGLHTTPLGAPVALQDDAQSRTAAAGEPPASHTEGQVG